MNKARSVLTDRCTQFGRALQSLIIEIICANSSQAKGRVERAHKTLKDRLVKELRLAGINTLDEGNAFLPAFVMITARGSRPTQKICTVLSAPGTISRRRSPGAPRGPWGEAVYSRGCGDG